MNLRAGPNRGLSMAGPDGLLKRLALNEEIIEPLGYERHDPVGAGTGTIRNGTGAKTVLLTESTTGPVKIDVSWARADNFEPQSVKKRRRRLSGTNEVVLSLYAKGLTYGHSVSKETISRIIDKIHPELPALIAGAGPQPGDVAFPGQGGSDSAVEQPVVDLAVDDLYLGLIEGPNCPVDHLIEQARSESARGPQPDHRWVAPRLRRSVSTAAMKYLHFVTRSQTRPLSAGHDGRCGGSQRSTHSRNFRRPNEWETPSASAR